MHKKNADGTYSEIIKKKAKRSYNRKSTETFIQDKQGNFLPISFEALEQLIKIKDALHEESIRLAPEAEAHKC